MAPVTTYAWQGTFGPIGNAPLIFETSYGNATFLAGPTASNVAVFDEWIHSVTSAGSRDSFWFRDGGHEIGTGGGADRVRADGWLFDLDTGAGNDVAILNAGAHAVDLGAGNDRAQLGAFVHEVVAGAGNDLITFSAGAGANRVDLGNAAARGRDRLTADGWIEEIHQGAGRSDVTLAAGASIVFPRRRRRRPDRLRMGHPRRDGRWQRHGEPPRRRQ